MNNTEEANELSKIDEIEIVSSKYHFQGYGDQDGRADNRIMIEMLIRGQVIIYKMDRYISGGGFGFFHSLVKDSEMRYLISEISRIHSGFAISKGTTLNRLGYCKKRDPDSVIIGLQSLFCMIDVSEYTSISSELMEAMDDSHYQFKEKGVDFHSFSKEVHCDSILGPAKIEYISTKTASILNPITAYLDHMGVVYAVIDKVRMLKLHGL